MFPALVAACCLVTGTVHTPSGAPIAHAQVTLRGPQTAGTVTDAKGAFSIEVSPGRYAMSVVARGYATVTVNTGPIEEGSSFNVVLEPADTPKLRTIGQVSVNGGFTLDRNVIPEMDVSRAQMDALGYTQVARRFAAGALGRHSATRRRLADGARRRLAARTRSFRGDGDARRSAT